MEFFMLHDNSRLLDNSQTKKLTVSKVADWSTRSHALLS